MATNQISQLKKRVVIYYTCCLSFSHFQLYAIEFILLYFTQHLITLLLSAFQQHNMWGVAFLFLFKACFFVLLLSILLFPRPWRRLHSHPELSSWISLLSHFSLNRGWNQTVFHFSFARGCAAPPPDYSSPALAYYSLSVCVLSCYAAYMKKASENPPKCSCSKGPPTSKQRLSHWLSAALSTSLCLVKTEPPADMRAQSTRGLSSSTALLGEVPLEDISMASLCPSTRFYQCDRFQLSMSHSLLNVPDDFSC